MTYDSMQETFAAKTESPKDLMRSPGGHLQDRGKRTSSPVHPRDHRFQQRDHCCHDQGDRKEDACKRMLRKPVVNLPSERFFYSLRSGLSPVAGMQGMTIVRKTTIVTIVVIPIVTFGRITVYAHLFDTQLCLSVGIR